MLQWLLRHRARAKFDKISPWIDGRSILDLGCGEGYVGEEIQRRLGKKLVLADVIPPPRRGQLPFVLCQEGALPFKLRSFDTVLLIFVLHHAEAPLRLLCAASTIARRLIVWESLRRGPFQAALLAWIDCGGNFLRSGGRMRPAAHFFEEAALRRAIQDNGLKISHQSRFGSWLHPQVLFVISNDECRIPNGE